MTITLCRASRCGICAADQFTRAGKKVLTGQIPQSNKRTGHTGVLMLSLPSFLTRTGHTVKPGYSANFHLKRQLVGTVEQV